MASADSILTVDLKIALPSFRSSIVSTLGAPIDAADACLSILQQTPCTKATAFALEEFFSS
jgi:hypothetical protein